MPDPKAPEPLEEPVGEAAKGRPDNGRGETEAVLEEGLPPEQQVHPAPPPPPPPHPK